MEKKQKNSPKLTADCRRFGYRVCDDVAEIITNEQVKMMKLGKFRGRQQIIDRIIREWNHLNLARNEAGTDSLDTGKI